MQHIPWCSEYERTLPMTSCWHILSAVQPVGWSEKGLRNSLVRIFCHSITTGGGNRNKVEPWESIVVQAVCFQNSVFRCFQWCTCFCVHHKLTKTIEFTTVTGLQAIVFSWKLFSLFHKLATHCNHYNTQFEQLRSGWSVKVYSSCVERQQPRCRSAFSKEVNFHL